LIFGSHQILVLIMFDENTKKFRGDFIAPGLGGLSAPDALTIRPDGNVVVPLRKGQRKIACS
jgi:hypothetical protein